MAGAFDIKILWTIVKDVFIYFDTRSDKSRNEVIAAHQAVNSAFIKTYDYLRNQNGPYVPKTDLAESWNVASAAVMKCNPELGNMLYMKSRFWLDPALFMNLRREDEIPELNDIVSEMERLRMSI